MQQLPERRTVRRKWSADKTAGPLVLLAEWMQKRMIQHAWPCRYVASWKYYDAFEAEADREETVYAVEFVPVNGAPAFSQQFWEAFDTALRIVTYEKDVVAWREDGFLYLDGLHYVDKYGKIRRGAMPAPF